MTDRSAITVHWPFLESDAPLPATQRRSWGKVPHEERFRRQHQKLLAAAATLAASGSYRETRIEDMVREARLSKSTFYDHYESKEHCFVDLYHRTHDALLRVVAEGVPGGAGSMDAVSAALDTLGTTLAGSRELAAVLRSEQQAEAPAIAVHRRANLQRLVQYLVSLGSRPGPSVPAENLEFLTRVLVYGVIAAVPDGEARPEFAHAALELLVNRGSSGSG